MRFSAATSRAAAPAALAARSRAGRLTAFDIGRTARRAAVVSR